jgi:hypothetical protein
MMFFRVSLLPAIGRPRLQRKLYRHSLQLLLLSLRFYRRQQLCLRRSYLHYVRWKIVHSHVRHFVYDAPLREYIRRIWRRLNLRRV